MFDSILEQMRRGETPDVERLTAQNPELADEIRQLVKVVAFVQGAANASDPSAALDARVAVSPKKPVLGDFEIVREIARGGMGVVYEAIQRSLDRRVALKVMLPGITVSREALERFSREARTAGGLQHQHIVPVYAIGEEDGVPFYAMQYIEGESLSDYLKNVRSEQGALDSEHFRRVAEWGAQAAAALDYAHRCGVVHRDIKPSNMLLDRDGDVWLTDFGLARRDTNVTITVSGDVLGTVRYMSPEQARGGSGRIDERTDVYSLGVSLYELLTLRPPFDGPDRESTLKQVLLDEPKRLRQLIKALPKPLETIVHRALEKEPERRYPSAALMGEDLRRYLKGAPLLTKPPGLIGQLRRMAVRHKAAAAFVSALFAVVLGFGLWMSWLYADAERLRTDAEHERTLAVQAAHKSERINTFFQDMLASADPGKLGREITVLEALNQAALTVGEGLSDEPELEAGLRLAVARTYQSLGQYREAETHARRAVELNERVRGADDAQTLFARTCLADVLLDFGKAGDAETLYRSIYETWQRLEGDEHAETLGAHNRLGRALAAQARHSEAEVILRESVEGLRRVLGPEHANTVAAMGSLANLLVELHKVDEGEALLNEVLAIERGRYGEDHPAPLAALRELAHFYRAQGRLDEAEATARRVFEISTRVLGEEHRDTLSASNLLALLLRDLGNLHDVEPIYRRIIEVLERTLGEDHPHTQATWNNLASLLQDLGRYDEAEEILKRLIKARSERYGEDHPSTITSINNLGTLYQEQRRLDEAETMLRQAVEATRSHYGADHPRLLTTLSNLALLLASREKFDEAEPLMQAVLQTKRRVLGAEHPSTLATLFNLASLCYDRGELQRSETLSREALAGCERTLGLEHPNTILAMHHLGSTLAEQGKYEEAETFIRRALQLQIKTVGENHPFTLVFRSDLGRTLFRLGRFTEAEQLFRSVLEQGRTDSRTGDWQVAWFRLWLGRCVAAQGRYEEAEAAIVDGYQALKAELGEEHRHTREALAAVVRLYEAWGKADRAAEFRAALQALPDNKK